MTEPRLVLRVGVTGHRQLAGGPAPGELEAHVREILGRLRAIAATAAERSAVDYAGGAPVVRVISPLAEGADRVVARAALAAGCELQCPLPFLREEYEADFADERSRAEFRALLGHATATLELDGARDRRDGAYERVGRMVLSQSDVLLAIWNGKPAVGQGGTGDIVADAVDAGIPVIWITASSPAETVLCCAADGGAAVEPLAHLADRLLPLLLSPGTAEAAAIRAIWARESERPSAFPFFRWFRALVTLGARGERGGPAPSREESDAAREQPGSAPPLEAPPPELGADLARADLLAMRFAERYRSTFLAIYVMSAAAVLFALLGFLRPLGSVVEILLILGILGLLHHARRRRWHEDWLELRLLGEQLRQLELLRPLGRVAPSFRPPAHAGESGFELLWVMWRYRARVREAGMATGRLDPPRLDACRGAVRRLVREQAAYHRSAAHLNHLLEHRLERAGQWLFGATAALCLLHILLHPPFGLPSLAGEAPPGSVAGDWRNQVLTLFSAFLPAVGAALAGIVGQGEFHKLATRSSAIARRLELLLARLSALEPLTSDRLGALADEAAGVMGSELLDWHLVFREKGPRLPA